MCAPARTIHAPSPNVGHSVPRLARPCPQRAGRREASGSGIHAPEPNSCIHASVCSSARPLVHVFVLPPGMCQRNAPPTIHVCIQSLLYLRNYSYTIRAAMLSIIEHSLIHVLPIQWNNNSNRHARIRSFIHVLIHLLMYPLDQSRRHHSTFHLFISHPCRDWRKGAG